MDKHGNWQSKGMRVKAESAQKASSLLIQGNFAPARSVRILRMAARVLAILLVGGVVSALAVYGLRVHLQDAVNRLASDTRELNEQNRELQVKMNYLQSFKNVEAAAARVPHLKEAPTFIRVSGAPEQPLPSRPHSRQEFPRVYGY